MPVCHSCGQEITIVDQIGRSETCLKCGADLHCCQNCDFFDPKAYNECREPSAERVLVKDRSNFCDYFIASSGRREADQKMSDAKKKLEELFNKRK